MDLAAWDKKGYKRCPERNEMNLSTTLSVTNSNIVGSNNNNYRDTLNVDSAGAFRRENRENARFNGKKRRYIEFVDTPKTTFAKKYQEYKSNPAKAFTPPPLQNPDAPSKDQQGKGSLGIHEFFEAKKPAPDTTDVLEFRKREFQSQNAPNRLLAIFKNANPTTTKRVDPTTSEFLADPRQKQLLQAKFGIPPPQPPITPKAG